MALSPSVRDVSEAIAHLTDSGVGEDGISARVLRVGGCALARILHAIVSPAVRLEFIPLAWRGGRLVVLYKGKGPPPTAIATAAFLCPIM